MSESFPDLLAELGFSEGFVSVCWQEVDSFGKTGVFQSTVVPVEKAPEAAAVVADRANVWFGINPVSGPERMLSGRGTASDVARLLVLPIDLDVKDGAMPSEEACWEVIETLSVMLNCPPVAVTHSGHGLQPLWAVDDGWIDNTDGESFNHGRARALLRRWGRLAAVVAERHGGSVDSVFDLARVLRVPQTMNRKDPDNVKNVTTQFKGGYALELSQVREVLAQYGIAEVDEDAVDFGEVVSVPSEWEFGPKTWPYVAKMVDGMVVDDVVASRHGWLLKCFTRLIAAWRCARISEGDFTDAQERIVGKFRELVQQGDNKRKVNDGEISGCWQWSLAKVCALPKNRALEECGGEKSKPPYGFTPHPMSVPDVVATREDGGELPTSIGNPTRFFDDKRGGLQVVKLSEAVQDLGPLRWGADETYWTWSSEGVWKPAYREVEFRCVRLLGDMFRNSYAGHVDTVIQSQIEELSCGPTPDWLNFKNGMLNWRTNELVPHDPSFESVAQFPLNYEPETECPEFDKFLSSILSPDYVELAWQMMGYMLYSGNPLQVAFMFVGGGGNGKGTLLRVIENFLGRENCAFQSLDNLNTNRFSAANLFGKCANLAGDIDATYQQTTAKFKSLTGEDEFSAERKHRNPFDFKSWAVPIFSANKIPGSSDTSRGYLRRWVILKFDRTITEPILNLSEKLTAELPGIVAKAVRHIAPLIEAEKFSLTGDALVGQDEFAQAIDQVRQWIDECCRPAPEYKATDRRNVLYQSYRAWASRNGNVPLRAQEFFTRLEGIGYKKARRGGYDYIDGIVIVEDKFIDGTDAAFATLTAGLEN